MVQQLKEMKDQNEVLLTSLKNVMESKTSGEEKKDEGKPSGENKYGNQLLGQSEQSEEKKVEEPDKVSHIEEELEEGEKEAIKSSLQTLVEKLKEEKMEGFFPKIRTPMQGIQKNPQPKKTSRRIYSKMGIVSGVFQKAPEEFGQFLEASGFVKEENQGVSEYFFMSNQEEQKKGNLKSLEHALQCIDEMKEQ